VAEILAAVQARVGEDFTPFLYEAPHALEQPATISLITRAGAVGARSKCHPSAN
jgi:hypothetical protein